MIQLRILSGNSAGKLFVAKAFPFSFGRAGSNTLAIAEPGVFERHFEIAFTRDGYKLAATAAAPVTVNGAPATEAILRNGDVISAGAAKIEFALAAAPQKGLGLRESAAWALVVLVAAAQAGCLVWLLQVSR